MRNGAHLYKTIVYQVIFTRPAIT